MSRAEEPLKDGVVVGDRYRIEEYRADAGRGGVYSCLDLREGTRRFGLRVVRRAHPLSDSAAHPGREFSLLLRICHPNLVRLLDFGIIDDPQTVFLVEEWIDGDDLLAGTEGMDVRRVLNVAISLFCAIQYLHARGVVHGRLNPAGILFPAVEGKRQVKVADYGMALFDATGPSDSRALLTYAAPEILMGRPADSKADVYSLGVILYQLLTRRRPFEDDDPGFLLQKQLQGSADMGLIERIGGGEGLCRLLSGLLAKDPSKRIGIGEAVRGLLDLPGVESHAGGDVAENHLSASPLVGRRRELARLQERVQRVREQGRGWTVFLTGDAGGGKSRCMEELRSWALLEGWQVVEGACDACEEAGYEPYRQILTRTQAADGPALFQFGGPARPVNAGGTLDASSESAAGQFRDLLTREVVRRVSERPTILMLHDFHWADEATNSVLDYLSSDIQAHPILMCVSCRTGEERKGSLGRVMELIIRQNRGEVVALPPLVKEDVGGFVAGMTGDNELGAFLGDWIFDGVGGNPFFLQEMLAHMVEQDVLRREHGGWALSREKLESLELPESVGMVLKRRLAQLTPAARLLVNWLATFQRGVSRRLLSSVIAQPPHLIEEPLKELTSRQIVRIAIDGMIELNHALFAEVVRSALPINTLRRMHRRIAETLETEFGAEDHVHEVAMHHIEGNSKGAAIAAVLESARRLRAEFDHENVLRCYEYVFKNRSALSGEELCMAAIDVSDSMLALGLSEKAIARLVMEMRRNRSINATLKARMLVQLAFAYQHQGDSRKQEACCKRGLRLLQSSSDTDACLARSLLWTLLSYPLVLEARPRSGLSCLDKALRCCPETEQGAIIAGRIHTLSATLHLVAGDLRAALNASKKAIEILSRTEDPYRLCAATSILAGIQGLLGRFRLACETHRRSIYFADRDRSVAVRFQSLGNFAECLGRMGRISEALKIAEPAIKSVEESRNPMIAHAFNAIMAEVTLASGNYKKTHLIISSLSTKALPNVALPTTGHVLHLGASLYFVLGRFDDSLGEIAELENSQTSEASFNQYELALALRGRILFERGASAKALELLNALDKAVTGKHWPYQMCLIKLHLAEVLLKGDQLQAAEKHARNALRLARGMDAMGLISHAHLLLGLIRSPLRGEPSEPDSALRHQASSSASSIQELHASCHMGGVDVFLETAWRAHAELSRIFRALGKMDDCVAEATKGYEILCRLEAHVPTEWLSSFYAAFERGQTKLELIRTIEGDRSRKPSVRPPAGLSQDDENAQLLLQVSAVVNSIREREPLLEAILDRLLPSIGVDRAFIFLGEGSSSNLELVRGRNARRESLTDARVAHPGVMARVFDEGMPFISSNLAEDPRLAALGLQLDGRLMCAPIRGSGRVIGVVYAHDPVSADFGESAINLFAAFCNFIAIALDNLSFQQQMLMEKKKLERHLHRVEQDYPELVGRSQEMKRVRERIGLAAASPLDILITGESGTGKELVARAIHRTGKRKGTSFVAVDCGALTDTLAEAELFGYRKGAFTGATENRQGLLEAAHEGIVFLDEISNLPLHLQAKLLRVLQEREIRRIGETTPRKIDIQVIAASNRDLLDEIRNGHFRRDLYYRLKGMEIGLPPLRERIDDVPLLIEWFLARTAESGGGGDKSFTPEAIDILCEYSYPGNVRELKNMVAGAYYSTLGVSIGTGELPAEVRGDHWHDRGAESLQAAKLYREIAEGRGSFDALVKGPFLKHEFGSALVRGVIERALRDAGGRYRDAFARLRVPQSRYPQYMQFLKRHGCYLDFRPFRRTSAHSEQCSS